MDPLQSTCLVDYDIQCRCMIKKNIYFSNLLLVKSNANTILGFVDLIQCLKKKLLFT